MLHPHAPRRAQPAPGRAARRADQQDIRQRGRPDPEEGRGSGQEGGADRRRVLLDHFHPRRAQGEVLLYALHVFNFNCLSVILYIRLLDF